MNQCLHFFGASSLRPARETVHCRGPFRQSDGVIRDFQFPHAESGRLFSQPEAFRALPQTLFRR